MAPVERVTMRVKEWRERRGMTEKQLATKAGISRGYLARLETARQDPKLSTLEKLAKTLKVDSAKLLKEKSPARLAAPGPWPTPSDLEVSDGTTGLRLTYGVDWHQMPADQGAGLRRQPADAVRFGTSTMLVSTSDGQYNERSMP